MMDAMGMYGLADDGTMTPEDRRARMMGMALMGNQPQQNGPAGMAHGLVAAMLMNPGMVRKAGQGLGQGVGNWMSGFNWDGMPGQNMMNGLSQQAAQNVATGGPM